jgi:hypothetical protein
MTRVLSPLVHVVISAMPATHVASVWVAAGLVQRLGALGARLALAAAGSATKTDAAATAVATVLTLLEVLCQCSERVREPWTGYAQLEVWAGVADVMLPATALALVHTAVATTVEAVWQTGLLTWPASVRSLATRLPVACLLVAVRMARQRTLALDEAPGLAPAPAPMGYLAHRARMPAPAIRSPAWLDAALTSHLLVPAAELPATADTYTRTANRSAWTNASDSQTYNPASPAYAPGAQPIAEDIAYVTRSRAAVPTLSTALPVPPGAHSVDGAPSTAPGPVGGYVDAAMVAQLADAGFAPFWAARALWQNRGNASAAAELLLGHPIYTQQPPPGSPAVRHDAAVRERFSQPGAAPAREPSPQQLDRRSRPGSTFRLFGSNRRARVGAISEAIGQPSLSGMRSFFDDGAPDDVWHVPSPASEAARLAACHGMMTAMDALVDRIAADLPSVLGLALPPAPTHTTDSSNNSRGGGSSGGAWEAAQLIEALLLPETTLTVPGGPLEREHARVVGPPERLWALYGQLLDARKQATLLTSDLVRRDKAADAAMEALGRVIATSPRLTDERRRREIDAVRALQAALAVRDLADPGARASQHGPLGIGTAEPVATDEDQRAEAAAPSSSTIAQLGVRHLVLLVHAATDAVLDTVDATDPYKVATTAATAHAHAHAAWHVLAVMLISADKAPLLVPAMRTLVPAAARLAQHGAALLVAAPTAAPPTWLAPLLLALTSYEAVRFSCHVPADAHGDQARERDGLVSAYTDDAPAPAELRQLGRSTGVILGVLAARQRHALERAQAAFAEALARPVEGEGPAPPLPALQPRPSDDHVLLAGAALRLTMALTRAPECAAAWLEDVGIAPLLELARDSLFYGQHAMIMVVLRNCVEAVRVPARRAPA